MLKQIGKILLSTHQGVRHAAYRHNMPSRFRIGQQVYKPILVIHKLVIAVQQ